MTMMEKMKRGISAGMTDIQVSSVCGVSESAVRRCRELCEKSGVEVRPSDTEILDWIQQGHCVLAICVFGEDGESEKPTGVIFEIDGHQDCAKDTDVRKAITRAMLANEKGK